jgi:hypothetical protein
VYTLEEGDLILASIQSARKGEREYSRRGSRLAKRSKVSKVNPWTGYVVSYLEVRRVKRIFQSPRYEPTDKDIEKILLAAAPFRQETNSGKKIVGVTQSTNDCFCSYCILYPVYSARYLLSYSTGEDFNILYTVEIELKSS